MGEVNPIHSNSSPVLKATKIPPLPIIVLGSVSFLLPKKCQVCIAKDHAADRIGTKLIHSQISMNINPKVTESIQRYLILRYLLSIDVEKGSPIFYQIIPS